MVDEAQRTAQLKEIVERQRVIPADQIDGFVEYFRLDGFTNSAGDFDEKKIMHHSNVIYAAQQQNPQPQPSDNARDALKRRHGVGVANATPNGSSQIQRGAAGRAALARRHGRKQQ
jgi:hypothetical protein